MGGPYFFRARSTISIARSTPAQKPRGWARTTRIMGPSPNGDAAPQILAGSPDMACRPGSGNVRWTYGTISVVAVSHDQNRGISATRPCDSYNRGGCGVPTLLM